MPYAYTFEYIKGTDNLVADALSRCSYMFNTVTVIHSMLASLLARMKMAASQDLQYQQELFAIRAAQGRLPNAPQNPRDSDPPTNDSQHDSEAPTRAPSASSTPSGLGPQTPRTRTTTPASSPVRTPEGTGLPESNPATLSPTTDPELPRSDWPTSRFTLADRLEQEGVDYLPKRSDRGAPR